MKIKILLLLMSLILLFMIGFSFVPAPGLQDYQIDLPGPYTLRRTSRDVIFIQYKTKDFLCEGEEGAIRHFTYDDTYIYFETQLDPLNEVLEYIYSAVNYKTKEYFEKASYEDLSVELGTELPEYNDWLSTSISEIDWTDPEIVEQQLQKINKAINP